MLQGDIFNILIWTNNNNINTDNNHKWLEPHEILIAFSIPTAHIDCCLKSISSLSCSAHVSPQYLEWKCFLFPVGLISVGFCQALSLTLDFCLGLSWEPSWWSIGCRSGYEAQRRAGRNYQNKNFLVDWRRLKVEGN